MTGIKLRPKLIRISGYGLVVFGVLNMIWCFRKNPSALDLSLEIAYSAIALTGLLATLVAESLGALDKRLDQIEGRLARMSTTASKADLSVDHQ